MGEPRKVKFGNNDKSGQLGCRITTSSHAKAAFYECWHVAKLAVFGFVLCDDFDYESDIGVLVEFKAVCIRGLRFFSMASGLSRLARTVDVLARSAVERSQSYICRKNILSLGEASYAAG